MSDFLRIERDDAVAIVTMNRPENRNALTDEDAIGELVAMCEAVNRDRSIRALVLTGAGPAFSAGGNLKQISQLGEGALGEPAQSRYFYRDGIQRVPLALCNLEVPTIAAVNGPAVGAGNDLACMCDIRIASEKATFAESFVKLGLIPGDGGAWLLQRALGASRACEMAFTGEAISAAQALEWGLVSRVVTAEELMPAALDLARRIASNPGDALRMTKRLMLESRHARLPDVLELSAALQALAHNTQAHRDALEVMLARLGAR
ncbi:crotonase/enoyl-CoA hydratase family protein [Pseudomonas sp. BN102]|uniref:crotonase/enoyl-CoA hydratase family protein n=1 Tax=Pseudomonas sp. BN102 TaxID=2567886 RepID=UPI002457651A|nr:crotonase/enoyl-CoA hydratase family protein [Pseudomonas sp. BN102]MDH4610454.1 crotonase/enoyl-CoA hydratase family protein [Pseudomonas sp. BN102]